MKKNTKFINRIVLIALFVMITSWVNAQSVTIDGTIAASDDKMPIAGANVYIKGTTTGTVSDLDGKFILQANVGDVVVISFVGYVKKEITVNASSLKLSISLDPKTLEMDEIVVVGYGTQKKSDLTGSVTSVSSKEINRKTVATFEQSLQGLAPGVTVVSNSGNPGAGASIQIRGVSSINNSNPLYVIDGVPSDNMNVINTNDIESVSILKDAAASAIYGSRGANGVILITTKKGKKGFHVNFESQFGIQKEWKRIDLLNAEEYAKYVNEVNFNAGRNGPISTRDPFNLEYDTDWQEEMFQTAPIQKHNLTVSGGNDLATYSLSGSYFNQQGIMLETGFKKYNFRATSEIKWKMLRFGESFAYNASIRQNEVNTVGGRSQVERMLTQTPLIPVHDTSQLGGYGGPTIQSSQDAVNPVGVAKLIDSKTKFNNDILGSIFGEAEIIEGLKYKITYGFSFYQKDKTIFTPEYSMGIYQANATPQYDTTYITNKYSLIENLLTYDKSFGNHNLTFLVGYTQERSRYTTQQNITDLYPDDSVNYTLGRKNHYFWGMASYLGRINYSYADKYLFQANIRRDGSSRFGALNRWGVFPSISAGWVLSKEGFLNGNNIISFLKLRGSWGTIGNQRIDDYVFDASLNNYQSYVFNGIIVDGTGLSSFPNDAVKWETKKSINFGAELGLFENKINITAEYYIEKSEDMLIPIRMPVSNGTDEFSVQNAGNLKNSGIELSLNYRNYDNVFKYSITGNLTTIKNEITDLGPTDRPLVGISTELGPGSYTNLGQPIGSFYGFKTDGLYTSADQIDPVFASRATVGDIKYVDLSGPDGVPDGILTDDDRTFLGSPIPTLTYGLNFNGEYKNFDFALTFQGVYGNKIFRETKLWTEGMYSNFNASTDVNDRFRAEEITITTVSAGNDIVVVYPANPNTTMPRAVRGDPNNNALRFSDRHIEDGSYLRLKDITVGYNLPGLINKVNIRVYLLGLNVLTFTKYSGYDPEIGVTNIQDEELRNSSNSPENLSRGIDNGYYPQARAIIGGIQISF